MWKKSIFQKSRNSLNISNKGILTSLPDLAFSFPFFSSPLLFTLAHQASSRLVHMYLLFCSFDRRSINPHRRDFPCALWPMVLLYTYSCWPSRNLRLRRGLRWRLMGFFSVEDGLRWRLMDFKVWHQISIRLSEACSYFGVRFVTRDNRQTRLEPSKGFNKRRFKDAISG